MASQRGNVRKEKEMVCRRLDTKENIPISTSNKRLAHPLFEGYILHLLCGGDRKRGSRLDTTENIPPGDDGQDGSGCELIIQPPAPTLPSQ